MKNIKNKLLVIMMLIIGITQGSSGSGLSDVERSRGLEAARRGESQATSNSPQVTTVSPEELEEAFNHGGDIEAGFVTLPEIEWMSVQLVRKNDAPASQSAEAQSQQDSQNARQAEVQAVTKTTITTRKKALEEAQRSDSQKHLNSQNARQAEVSTTMQKRAGSQKDLSLKSLEGVIANPEVASKLADVRRQIGARTKDAEAKATVEPGKVNPSEGIFDQRKSEVRAAQVSGDALAAFRNGPVKALTRNHSTAVLPGTSGGFSQTTNGVSFPGLPASSGATGRGSARGTQAIPGLNLGTIRARELPEVRLTGRMAAQFSERPATPSIPATETGRGLSSSRSAARLNEALQSSRAPQLVENPVPAISARAESVSSSEAQLVAAVLNGNVEQVEKIAGGRFEFAQMIVMARENRRIMGTADFIERNGPVNQEVIGKLTREEARNLGLSYPTRIGSRTNPNIDTSDLGNMPESKQSVKTITRNGSAKALAQVFEKKAEGNRSSSAASLKKTSSTAALPASAPVASSSAASSSSAAQPGIVASAPARQSSVKELRGVFDKNK